MEVPLAIESLAAYARHAVDCWPVKRETKFRGILHGTHIDLRKRQMKRPMYCPQSRRSDDQDYNLYQSERIGGKQRQTNERIEQRPTGREQAKGLTLQR